MTHSATARLFVALDLPAALCADLHAWARSAAVASARGAAPQGMRLLDPESMHLTIHFLGSRRVEEIEALCSTVERCARPLGECSFGAPLWLPKRRPRALAVEVHDDSQTLAALHREVLAEVEATAIESRPPECLPKAGPLRPHVTVARLRRGAAPRQRLLPPTPQRSFAPERLTLYRSWLSPEGASYEALASCATLPLAASG